MFCLTDCPGAGLDPTGNRIGQAKVDRCSLRFLEWIRRQARHGNHTHPTTDPRMAASRAGPGAGLCHLHSALAVVLRRANGRRPLVPMDSRTFGPAAARPGTDRMLLLFYLGGIYSAEPLCRDAPPATGFSPRPAAVL